MKFEDRFTNSDVHAGASLYRCWTCGAVVEDHARHEEWHQSLENQHPDPPKDFDVEGKR